MKKIKIYISGAITNNEKLAPKQFNDAAKKLIDLGFDVVNPMTLPHKHDKTWLNFMREDLKALVYCDAIYMLKGWSKSKGANIEFDLAKSLGLFICCER